MIKNIIILILILALIAIVIFLDIPKVQGILSLRKQVKEQKEIFSDKQILLTKIEKLTKDYEENQEDLKKLNYILPFGQDIPNLIVQLEALSFESGLILENIDFLPSEEEAFSKTAQLREGEEVTLKDYRTLAINLKLIGDYSAFESLLKLMEENIRLMDITSIDFAIQSGEGFQIFDFNLDLRVYYQ